MTPEDETFLRRAIALASTGRARGEEPYGSLLVSATGAILAEDWNTELSERDITAHPELKLARWAGREFAPESARTTTMYTSCEPCSMCAGAIRYSGLGRVVFALSHEQFDELEPDWGTGIDGAAYEGPALFDEARVPIDGFY